MWLGAVLFTLAGQVSKFPPRFRARRNAANIDRVPRVQQVSVACVSACVRWCVFEPWGVRCCCSWSCCSSNRDAASWSSWSTRRRWEETSFHFQKLSEPKNVWRNFFRPCSQSSPVPVLPKRVNYFTFMLIWWCYFRFLPLEQTDQTVTIRLCGIRLPKVCFYEITKQCNQIWSPCCHSYLSTLISSCQKNTFFSAFRVKFQKPDRPRPKINVPTGGKSLSLTFDLSVTVFFFVVTEFKSDFLFCLQSNLQSHQQRHKVRGHSSSHSFILSWMSSLWRWW